MSCILDTNSIDLNVASGQLTADLKVSPDAGNGLVVRGNGVYAGGLPVGTGPIAWPTASPPTGWLLCDGTAVNRSTYAALFAVIATAFGAGDGSTTFNLPDLRGRVPVGKGSNVVVSTLGNTEGVAEPQRRGTLHRHTPHTHSYTAPAAGASIANINGNNPGANPATTGAADGGSGVATDPLDGGAYFVVNYIIKAL